MDGRVCSSYRQLCPGTLPARPSGPLRSPRSPQGPETKKVRFEPSGARRALSTLKIFTNRSIQAIKEYRGRKRQEYASPQWISEAACDSKTFTNPRPLRPCMQTLPASSPVRGQSLRSHVLFTELNYHQQADAESLIDFGVDTAAIDRMWMPLSPQRHIPDCIKDIEDLFR